MDAVYFTLSVVELCHAHSSPPSTLPLSCLPLYIGSIVCLLLVVSDNLNGCQTSAWAFQDCRGEWWVDSALEVCIQCECLPRNEWYCSVQWQVSIVLLCSYHIHGLSYVMEKASLSFKWTVWASLQGIVNLLLSRTLHIYMFCLCQ